MFTPLKLSRVCGILATVRPRGKFSGILSDKHSYSKGGTSLTKEQIIALVEKSSTSHTVGAALKKAANVSK